MKEKNKINKQFTLDLRVSVDTYYFFYIDTLFHGFINIDTTIPVLQLDFRDGREFISCVDSAHEMQR